MIDEITRETPPDDNRNWVLFLAIGGAMVCGAGLLLVVYLIIAKSVMNGVGLLFALLLAVVGVGMVLSAGLVRINLRLKQMLWLQGHTAVMKRWHADWEAQEKAEAAAAEIRRGMRQREEQDWQAAQAKVRMEQERTAAQERASGA